MPWTRAFIDQYFITKPVVKYIADQLAHPSLTIDNRLVFGLTTMGSFKADVVLKALTAAARHVADKAPWLNIGDLVQFLARIFGPGLVVRNNNDTISFQSQTTLCIAMATTCLCRPTYFSEHDAVPGPDMPPDHLLEPTPDILLNVEPAVPSIELEVAVLGSVAEAWIDDALLYDDVAFSIPDDDEDWEVVVPFCASGRTTSVLCGDLFTAVKAIPELKLGAASSFEVDRLLASLDDDRGKFTRCLYMLLDQVVVTKGKAKQDRAKLVYHIRATEKLRKVRVEKRGLML